MTRPPQSARSWVLRGLLVLVFLAGLGLAPGAHCPDPAVAAGTHSAEFDECHLARVTAVSTVAGARMSPPSAGVRTEPVALPERNVRSRPVPAVTLATIGVSRT